MVDPELTEGITYLSWPENAPQEELENIVGERGCLVSLLVNVTQ